jgi:hypothetical protein
MIMPHRLPIGNIRLLLNINYELLVINKLIINETQ